MEPEPIEPPPFEPAGEDAGVQTATPAGAAVSVTNAGGGGAAPASPSATAPGEALSAREARYLRIYETYPSLPRSLWERGRIYTVVVQICVSTEGLVREVVLRQGAAPELDAAVLATLRTWRYRPRVVAGAPRAFCHLMKILYEYE